MAIYLFFFILISLVRSIFFKTNGVLSCGIFGFCGNGSVDSVRYLGIENDSRGGDGTGFFFDNKIYKGVGSESRFKNLIKKCKIRGNKESKLFIGHTRKATVGTHTLPNTHPFEIEILDDDGNRIDKMIFSHNGVIYNIDELCEKYNLPESHFTVDSHGLGILISKHGYKILEEYVGYAALSWTFISDPKTIYLYHGKSQDYDYTTSKPEEERPLFVLKNKGSMYYSSLKEPLEIIDNSEDSEIFTLNHNVVFKITNGNFVDATKISRERANIGIYSYKYPSTSRTVNSSTTNTTSQGTFGFNSFTPINITMESIPDRFRDEDFGVVYYKGRYYTFNIGQELRVADGKLFINDTGSIFKPALDVEVDIEEIDYKFKNETHKLKAYYFFKGAMLNSKEDFKKVMMLYKTPSSVISLAINNPAGNIPLNLSPYSKYPLTFLPVENNSVSQEVKLNWYHKGYFCDNETKFEPLFSDYVFVIKRGRLFSKEKKHVETTDPDYTKKLDESRAYLDSKFLNPSMFNTLPLAFRIAIFMYVEDRFSKDLKGLESDSKQDKLKKLVSLELVALADSLFSFETYFSKYDDPKLDCSCFDLSDYVNWAVSMVSIVDSEDYEVSDDFDDLDKDTPPFDRSIEEEEEDSSIEEAEEEDEQCSEIICDFLLNDPFEYTMNSLTPFDKSALGNKTIDILRKHSALLYAELKEVAGEFGDSDIEDAIRQKSNLN